MDEIAVLDHLIKYLKQMQNRVNILEEQDRKRRRTESNVVMEKSQKKIVEDEVSSDYVGSTSTSTSTSTSDINININDVQDVNVSFPEIEAKVCDKSVLLKIHCQNNKGLLVNLIAEVESLNLFVSTANVSSFGSFALEITVVAEMEEKFNLTMKELVKALQSAVQLPPQTD